MPFAVRPPPDSVGAAWPAIVIGVFVAFGGVLYGYDTGTISDILGMRYWLDHFSTGYIDPKTGKPGITSSQRSEIVSILSAGTFFGALTAAPSADFFGRKYGMMVSTVVFTFGVILQTAATAIPIFVAGRFFAGYGVGMISATIPLFQAETAPRWIRGSIVSCYQWAITIGLLLASVVGNSSAGRNDSGSYRVPVAVQFAWALILFFGMMLLPETPRMYIKRGQPEKAAKSLSRLRRLDTDHPAIVEELQEIIANHEYEIALGKASWIDCFKGGLGFRLLTGCLLQALQQLTERINFIFYYGTSFFQSGGFPQPFILSVITSVVNVCSTVPGLYMVEAWGRRPLLLFGAAGMAVCQFIVAAVGTAIGNDPAAKRAEFSFICIYIFFFACSWGPCAWVVTSEIFPLKIRAKSLAMTTASNWLLNWAIAYATPYMVDAGAGNANLGPKVFFIWGSACFVCYFFIWSMVYETKGLTLEQVDELYAKVPHAWQSKGFVPTVSFQDVRALQGTDARKMSLADMEATAIRKKSVVHDEDMEKQEA